MKNIAKILKEIQDKIKKIEKELAEIRNPQKRANP